jgi:hypothetical protein
MTPEERDALRSLARATVDADSSSSSSSEEEEDGGGRKWDCESILSTYVAVFCLAVFFFVLPAMPHAARHSYSNLENHPNLLREKPSAARIRIGKKVACLASAHCSA